ncbi:MAG: response regulator [Anaerolineaceae bacterium]|nr:response regulator [Anaerolineaceae bacterium]
MAPVFYPILVVEDIKSVREMLEINLQLRGYEVVSASNGADALEILKTETPSLILTDILMPKMDGFCFVHELRQHPRLRHIPVIFLSATFTQVEDYEFARRLGVERFIEKPFDTEDLMLSVGEILTGKKTEHTPMEDSRFYGYYLDRLEKKLNHQNEQIIRMQRLLQSLPVDQRDHYVKLLEQQKEERETIIADLESARANYAKLKGEG